MEIELAALLDELGAAESTQREAAIAVRALAAAARRSGRALPACLAALLDLSRTGLDWGPHRDRAGAHAEVLDRLRAHGALLWTADWHALQRAIVAAGMPMRKNPVTALLKEAGGRVPQELDADWARAIDRRHRAAGRAETPFPQLSSGSTSPPWKTTFPGGQSGSKSSAFSPPTKRKPRFCASSCSRSTGWPAGSGRAPQPSARRSAGTFAYPGPAVDLGRPEIDSRSRRWIPAQIRAALDCDTVPRFTPADPIRRDPARPAMSDETWFESGRIDAPILDFAEMVRQNAVKSQQRLK